MATSLPDFDPKQSFALFSKHGHSGWLGLQFVDHGPDWVELKLPWREDLLGEEDRHVLASGPIISLLDMASGLSIWTATKTFTPIATLDLRVDYQRPAKERSAVIGRLLRSLIFIQAALCTTYGDVWAGLVILSLWPWAAWLSHRFYSS